MPISWQYTDMYGVIIWYITDHLDPTNYLLTLPSSYLFKFYYSSKFHSLI